MRALFLALLLATPCFANPYIPRDQSRPSGYSGHWVRPECASASYDAQEGSSCRRISEEEEEE